MCPCIHSVTSRHIHTWGQRCQDLLRRLVHKLRQPPVALLRQRGRAAAGQHAGEGARRQMHAARRCPPAAGASCAAAEEKDLSLFVACWRRCPAWLGPATASHPTWKKMTPRRTALGGSGTGKLSYSSGTASPAAGCDRTAGHSMARRGAGQTGAIGAVQVGEMGGQRRRAKA